MSGRRRRLSAEFKVEAAHRVIDTGRPVAEVARELTLGDALLAGGVASPSQASFRIGKGQRTVMKMVFRA
jgi:hypothetical protein